MRALGIPKAHISGLSLGVTSTCIAARQVDGLGMRGTGPEMQPVAFSASERGSHFCRGVSRRAIDTVMDHRVRLTSKRETAGAISSKCPTDLRIGRGRSSSRRILDEFRNTGNKYSRYALR